MGINYVGGKVDSVTPDLDKDAMAKRKVAADAGTTAGKGLGAKENAGTGAYPKPEQGESTASFGERMRQYRALQATPAVEGQRKGLKALAPKPDPKPTPSPIPKPTPIPKPPEPESDEEIAKRKAARTAPADKPK